MRRLCASLLFSLGLVASAQAQFLSPGERARAHNPNVINMGEGATSGQLNLNFGTITTNRPVPSTILPGALNITGTWNNAATTFDAPLFMNVVNTASHAGSLFSDFQSSGTTMASVGVDGTYIAGTGSATSPAFGIGTRGSQPGGWYMTGSSFRWVAPDTATVMGFQDGSAFVNGWMGLAGDLFGNRAIVNNSDIDIRDLNGGTTAQAFRAYNNNDATSGTPTNYERGTFDFTTTSNVLTIGTQAGGTGTVRPVVIIGASVQLPNEVRVTSDFTVTSSTVLTNVTGLSVTVAAGRTYTFQTELFVTDAAAGGVQAAIAGTATATAIQYTGFTIADNAIKGKGNATALATAVGSTVTTETAGIIVRITGTITVNAAGTLTVQMAQNTSNATATTAKRGSYFFVHDMP